MKSLTAELKTAFQAADFRFAPLPADWAKDFVVITGYNPDAETDFSAAQNEGADQALALALTRLGVRHHRVDGGSFGSEGQIEPGWAAEVTFAQGLELGRSFEQVGIFLILGGRVHLVGCLDGEIYPAHRDFTSVVG